MRIVFLGTGGFATYPLVCLLSCHDIELVVTSSDDAECPVGKICNLMGLPLLATGNPNQEETVELICDKHPDILVVADYGYILKDLLISVPRLAPLNLHPSLLPRYRGPAPIQRAIMNDERKTGVATFILTRDVDSGNLLNIESTPIGNGETYGELRTRLSRIGGRLLLSSIELVKEGFRGYPQQGDSTYAPKIRKEERIIDWREDAKDIENLIHGLSPKPGAYTVFRDRRLIILRAKAVPSPEGEPGKIINDDPLLVSTCDGLVKIIELRPEGKVTMSSSSFRLGYKPKPGETMGV